MRTRIRSKYTFVTDHFGINSQSDVSNSSTMESPSTSRTKYISYTTMEYLTKLPPKIMYSSRPVCLCSMMSSAAIMPHSLSMGRPALARPTPWGHCRPLKDKIRDLSHSHSTISSISYDSQNHRRIGQ